MKKLSVLLIAGIILFLGACVKQDFDKPPIGELPVGTVYTIAELRKMYVDSGAYQFPDTVDASVYATVTMDESSGNIYKSAYVQDAGGAVNLHFNQTGGVRVGDSIRVYLKGVILSEYHGMFQLDNVKNDSSIVILANERYIQPKTVTIAELNDGAYQAQLIRLDSVEFSQSELGKTWADPNNSANRQLEDCYDNQIVVRTSSYATFAADTLPDGKGDLVAIAGVYDETAQLYIRSLSEVNLTGERCGGGGGGGTINPVDEVNETFESAENYTDIAIEGWSNIIVAGDRTWQGKVYNTDKYAQATGYNSGLSDMECWLITPPVKNQNGDKKLNFKSAMAYWVHEAGHQPLTVLASTDFDGSNFETATWTELSPVLPDANGANYDWVESGEVSLADFTGNVAIAFKYKGSDTESTSIQLDNVVISANGGGGGQGVTSLDEDFSSLADYDPVSNIDGWGSFIINGSREWIAKSYNDNVYMQATSYNSNEENEMWMTTPKIDLDAMTNPKFSFDNAVAYWTHDGFEVYISTDFDGSNIESATWTKLDCTIAGEGNANYEWISSGTIDLSGYSGQAYIGFKYTGDGNAGLTASYQIDNVKLWDE